MCKQGSGSSLMLTGRAQEVASPLEVVYHVTPPAQADTCLLAACSTLLGKDR